MNLDLSAAGLEKIRQVVKRQQQVTRSRIQPLLDVYEAAERVADVEDSLRAAKVEELLSVVKRARVDHARGAFEAHVRGGILPDATEEIVPEVNP